MQITMTPTDKFETVEGAPCRVWTGTTESGVPVHAWVRMVSAQTHDAEALAVFERELQALPKARREGVSYDIRFFVD